MDWVHSQVCCDILQRLQDHQRKNVCDLADCVFEDVDQHVPDHVVLSELSQAPPKLDDDRVEVQDPLEEVNLGGATTTRITFISKFLPVDFKNRLIALLIKYQDCFVWDYHEMPGLDRSLVEHQLPIKPGFRPYKHPPRRMANKVILKVKEEIERLLKAGFIRTARYVEQLSNIVPVIKKNGKLRVCIDFRDINRATPKDEYPMLIDDTLVDSDRKSVM